MNKFLVTIYVSLMITVVGLAVAYPEDFAIALGFFVLGSLLGGVVAYNLFTNVHDKGFERSQKLSEKQVGNPAAIWREARLTQKEAAKQFEQPVAMPTTRKPQPEAIPQFEITGLE